MCDLIDLNSPTVKRSLASPLIPTPKNVELDESEQSPNRLITEKRTSPGSNPFDKALHETAEYISKKGDPFEVMLQRALKCKSKKNADLRALNFMDDFTPKRKKKYLKMMNKTLDDSLTGDSMDLFNNERGYMAKLEKGAINPDANNADIVYNDNTAEGNNIIPKQSHDIFIMDKNLLESSILNQLATSTLLETDCKRKENSEIPVFIEENTLPEKFTLPTSMSLKPLHFRHSSVQEDRESLEKLLYLDHKRSKSTTNVSRKASQGDSSAVSSFLDRGFLESRQSERSVFSTLSNVSSIARLNSISNISSSVNATMNHAFLDSSSLKTSHEKINTTVDSAEITATRYGFSDLIDKFNRLKCTIHKTSSVPHTKERTDESDSIKEESNERITNDKLIDIDVFPPELNFSKEDNKSTISTGSSDSVFTVRFFSLLYTI